jgi:hypothetical protein
LLAQIPSSHFCIRILSCGDMQVQMQTMYSENPYAKRCRFVPAAAPNATHRMGTLPWYPFVRRSIWSGERRKGNRFVVEEEEV